MERHQSAPRQLAAIPPAVRDKLSDLGLSLELADEFKVEAFKDPSRFDFKARAEGRPFEIRYALGGKADDTSAIEPMFARTAQVFVHNFAEDGTVCDPVPVDPKFIKAMNADDIVRVCFTPKSYLGGEFRQGVTFAVLKRNVAMLLLVVLTDEVFKYATTPSVFGLSF